MVLQIYNAITQCTDIQLYIIVLVSNFCGNVAGVIALLDEPMPELKIFALRKLDSIVNEFWPEISESIEKM